jgi:hypothetical protein
MRAMNKINIKKKQVTLLIILLIVIPKVIKWTYHKLEKTSIVKIEGLDNNYVIINPPKDLMELKEVIVDYYDKNPINELPTSESDSIHQYFHRESKKTPRSVTIEDFNTGMKFIHEGDNHQDDIIALVIFYSEENKREYSLYRLDRAGMLLNSITIFPNGDIIRNNASE